jgi:hypothetical protein
VASSSWRGFSIAVGLLGLVACLALVFVRPEHPQATAPSIDAPERPPEPVESLASPAGSAAQASEARTDAHVQDFPAPSIAPAYSSPSGKRVKVRGLLVRSNETDFGRADFAAANLVVLRTDVDGLERTFAAHEGKGRFVDVDLSAGGHVKNGQFEVTLDLPHPLEAGRAELVLIVTFAYFDERERAAVALPSELASEIDLGVVQLEAPRDLAHGYVRDESGAPVPSVRVHARPRLESRRQHAQRFGSWTAGITTVQRGEFTVQGWILGDALDLVAERGRHAKEADLRTATLESVPVGARDLVLVMHATHHASIAGRILVDEPDMLAALELGLPGPPEKLLLMDDRPEFRFRGVAPLRHRLEVRRECDHAVMLALDELEVREGEACTDPRLDPIDLRGRLHWLEAKLERVDGKPYSHVMVQLRYPNGGRLDLPTEVDGRLRLLYMGEPPKLEIITPSKRYVPFDPGVLVRME